MAKPDYAFATSSHTAYAVGKDGDYRLEPGGRKISLHLDRQSVPQDLLDAELERVLTAWVIARGGRALNLNGSKRPITPQDLNRPPMGPVRRLVSIAPSNAEIVGALGAVDMLVGAESSSDYPPEVRALPRLGPDLHVDMERLAALEPDLVLASLTVPGMERNIAALERLNIPYLVLAPRNLEEICRDVERVGKAIGRQSRALEIVQEMGASVARLREARREKSPVPVYLEWWPKPMFTPGAACWTNELIELAGGINVFRHLERQSAEIDAADVAAADPRIIFVSWCGVPHEKLDPQRVLNRPGLEGVRAVKERRVYAIDEAFLGRPGPRVIEGIRAMAEKIDGAIDSV